jgi:hypothetical protein
MQSLTTSTYGHVQLGHVNFDHFNFEHGDVIMPSSFIGDVPALLFAL